MAKLNTNSNAYIIAYSCVMVVIVAFLLAFISSSLKPTQDVNVALDKKKQILAALNIRDLSNDASAKKYQEVITADAIVDVDGNIVEAGEQGGEKAGFKLNSADYKAGKLALYICNVDGKKISVVPVYGMGLWGPIGVISQLPRMVIPSMAHTSTMKVRPLVLVLRSRTQRLGRISSSARLSMMLPVHLLSRF